MTNQVTLTDDDYAALVAASARTGEPIEALVHEAIADHFQPLKQIGSYQYPTGEPDTSEDEAEDEELAQLLGPEKPWLSDMVIEDRGPR